MPHLVLFFLCILFLLPTVQAQEVDSNKLVIKPVLAMQMWSTYTTDQRLYNADNQQYEAVDNRLNFLLHRSRIGLKGSYGSQWAYDFTGSLDFVGQDVLAGTVGGTNNSASPRFRIWNADVQYKAFKQSEGLYFSMGYNTPQLSRESITSPFSVNSFEKAWSQNYIRRHVTGTGPGRIIGLNIGGLTDTETTQFALNYDVGIYNPRYTDFGGNSSGIEHNVLLTYRLGIHFGDPEFTKYSRGHKFNYKGQRKGITLAMSGSYEGSTDVRPKNTSFGVDLLANFGDFNLAGEWMQLDRDRDQFQSTASTGFIRLGYYTEVEQKGLEPVIAYVFFSGPTDLAEQTEALALGAFSGTDNYLELTLNYYISAKSRLSLSYTLRNGDAGDADPTTVLNNYFQQDGVGAINKGDYLGFGLLFTL